MSTVRIALDHYGQVKELQINDSVLHSQTIQSAFQVKATGLKYCLDGVWTAVEMKDDSFQIPPLRDSQLFVVVNNVFTVDGCDGVNFDTCMSEYTGILKQKSLRHLAVIIGNPFLHNKNDQLLGARTDVEVMTMMLSSPPFNYTVLKCTNLTERQMKRVTKDAEDLCGEDLKSFLWFISTHGFVSEGQQMLKGNDGGFVRLTDLMITTPDKSTPKLYFVNACRLLDGHADEIDGGTEIQVSYDSAVPGGGDNTAADDDGKEGKQTVNRFSAINHPNQGIDSLRIIDTDIMTIPCRENFLFFFACPLGQQTYDFVPFVKQSISWLVHCLREAMKRNSLGEVMKRNQEHVNLLDLLTDANGFCSTLEILDRKYTFVLEHRLTSDEELCFSLKDMN